MHETARASDDVDLGDPLVLDREPEHGEEAAVRRDDDARTAVHKRDRSESGSRREHAGLVGHGACASDLGGDLRRHGEVASTAHDVGREQHEQRVDGTAA